MTLWQALHEEAMAFGWHQLEDKDGVYYQHPLDNIHSMNRYETRLIAFAQSALNRLGDYADDPSSNPIDGDA